MIRAELDAAGVRDPSLREAYRQCRVINASHGKTFFLATRLLTPKQRPAVHALYGFARYADDILDDMDDTYTNIQRAQHLQGLAATLGQYLGDGDRESEQPVVTAVTHTARTYDIEPQLFDDFLASMRMDLRVTDYPTRADLGRYMYGSAEVIGLQMLPVLGTVGPREEAAPFAAALGKAFQLTNFLRDVDEDLRRGRVYLPADELTAHGVDRDVLLQCQATGRVTAPVRKALAEQVAITRRVYAQAHSGIALLAPVSRPCISAAFSLYSQILQRIEDIDYEIFDQRATVGTGRRLAVAGVNLARSYGARIRQGAQRWR